MPRRLVRGSTAERLAAYVDRSDADGCWPWTGGRRRGGYGQIAIDRGGPRYTSEPAHRVALELALGRPLGEGMFALHGCDNPPCCRVGPGHVYEGTHRQNMFDRNGRGRTARGARSGPALHPEQMARGSRHGLAKLTEEQVAEIRRRYAAGGVSQVQLGAEFGVNQTKISDIIRRRTWAHVP